MTVGSSPSATRPPSGKHQRARRPDSAADDLGVDPEVAPLGLLVEHEQHLDQALEVVALVAAVLACRVGELAGQRLVEAGEALEVVVRQPDREAVGRDRAAHAERAAGVHLAAQAAPDLDRLEAAAAEGLGEGAFDQPLKPTLEPLQSHRDDATGATPREVVRRAAGTITRSHARVAELADAEDSGSCARKGVGVQVPPRAPKRLQRISQAHLAQDGSHGCGESACTVRHRRGILTPPAVP